VKTSKGYAVFATEKDLGGIAFALGGAFAPGDWRAFLRFGDDGGRDYGAIVTCDTGKDRAGGYRAALRLSPGKWDASRDRVTSTLYSPADVTVFASRPTRARAIAEAVESLAESYRADAARAASDSRRLSDYAKTL